MILEGQDVNPVPVAAGDRLVSMITRDHVLRVLAAKMELELRMGPSPIRTSADAVQGGTIGSQ